MKLGSGLALTGLRGMPRSMANILAGGLIARFRAVNAITDDGGITVYCDDEGGTSGARLVPTDQTTSPLVVSDAINGRKAWRFDNGATHRLATDIAVSLPLSDLEIVIVCSLDSALAGQGFLLDADWGGSPTTGIWIYGAGAPFWLVDNDSGFCRRNTPAVPHDDTARVMELRYRSDRSFPDSPIHVFFDGVEQTTDGSYDQPSSTLVKTIYIGRSSANASPIRGLVEEIMITREPTAAQRTGRNALLLQDTGIAVVGG